MTTANKAELINQLDKLIVVHNQYIDSVWKGHADLEKSPKTVEALLALIEDVEREAEIRGVKRATSSYVYNMPMRSMRSRNTGMKLYAIKFFNTKIKERRASLLAALQNKEDTNE